MLQLNKPYLTNFQSFISYENVFNQEECNYICSLAWQWEDGLTQGSKSRNKEVRDADVFWLHFRQDLTWIWERLKYHIEEANSRTWHFDLQNFHEHIQLTRYTKSGHYDWHVDNGNEKSSHRKISCVVNLTNEYDYKGGGTLIKTGKNPILLPKQQGSLNIFPSYTLHKAKRINKGERKSLVCWVGGSHYR